MQMRILEITAHVHRRLNNTVSKILSKITGRSIAEEALTTTENILLKMRDRSWSCFGHVLRMDRLVRNDS